MSITIKHIGIRSIILTLMLLLCIPCSLKREIKRALDIPVSNQNQESKTNKTAVCQFLTNQSTRPVHKTAKELQKPAFLSFTESTAERTTKISSVLYPAYPARETSIPIHILNEQYLI